MTSLSKMVSAGVGLRPTHYNDLLTGLPKEISWVEVISENYIDSLGRPRDILKNVREHYEVSLHGVSMNLASTDTLNMTYLKNLKNLIEDIKPVRVSDHLCWTGAFGHNLHDLLPFPMNRESFDLVASKVAMVQEILNREILIENVSTYLTLKSELTEWDFLIELCEKTGAKILLDLNNIYVSAINQEYDPYDFINSVPLDMVGEIHLAGYTEVNGFLFDTHSRPVYPHVWKLFENVISKRSDIPFMVEWDEDIPSFEVLMDEVKKGDLIRREYGK